jgi:hypothetical protein
MSAASSTSSRAGLSNSPKCSAAPPNSPHAEKSCSTSEPASIKNESRSPRQSAPPPRARLRRIHAVIDTLGDTQKQQLLRLLIEDVRGELSGASGKRTFARFACTGTPARLSPLDVGQGRRLLEV